MNNRISKSQWILLLSVLLSLFSFFFSNAKVNRIYPTTLTVIVQHLVILLKFGILAFVIYLIKDEISYEKSMKFYVFGLGTGLLLALLITILRFTGKYFFSTGLYQAQWFDLVLAIVYVIHLIALVPTLFRKNFNLLSKISLILIVFGQLIFFLSPLDGVVRSDEFIMVTSPYAFVNLSYFFTRGIYYTIAQILSILAQAYIVKEHHIE